MWLFFRPMSGVTESIYSIYRYILCQNDKSLLWEEGHKLGRSLLRRQLLDSWKQAWRFVWRFLATAIQEI